MGQTDASSLDRPRSTGKAEAILEGAMREFLEHGYAAASMDRVAVAAGVSKATVYSHFRDKESLFNALIQRMVREKFLAAFNPQDSQLFQAEPSVVLRHLATHMLDSVKNNPQILSFMRLIVGESGRFPELAHAYVHHLAKPVLEMLTQYLASRPELKLPDPEATARTVVGTLVYFIILQEVMHGKDILPMERDRIIDSLIYLITVTD